MMRLKITLLACASLFACGQPSGEADAPEPSATAAAALSYEGAGYGDDDVVKRAHGERIATLMGCNDCHRPNYQGGNLTADDPGFGSIYASNISLKLPGYSDAELEQLLREGVPKDGREMTFMPSEMFQNLSDADMAALIAYLRTIEPSGEPQPAHEPGPALTGMREAGVYTHTADMVQRFSEMVPTDLGDATAKGRYIAMSACTECHNGDLTGFTDFSPDLIIAGAFEEEQFLKLMNEGVGVSKPDLGLMSAVAQARFSNFTEDEQKALFAYLKERAEAAPAE